MPQLATLDKCTGCSACASICAHKAISMIEEQEGYLVPTIDREKCVHCKLCEKACPVVSSEIKMGDMKPEAYAMWSLKDRTLSSSGGAFSAFARNVIDKGGVVFGAVYDENLRLHHTEATTIADLEPMRGSKYMQSEMEDSFLKVKHYLLDGRYVLFCGTPCQVAGLRSFLKKDYENLLTLDLACHGVPSNKIFQEYKKKLENRLGFAEKNIKVVNYEFRRRDGWGKAPSISSPMRSCIPIYGVDALYMEAFNASALFRECCYSCRYSSIPRIGDCSIADFWGLGRYGTPFKHDVMTGVSLVLINTGKGKKWLESLDEVFIEKRSLDEALIENPNLRIPSKKHPHRDEIVQAFLDENMTLEDIDKKYHLVDHSLKAIVKNIASKYGLFKPVKRVYNWYKTR